MRNADLETEKRRDARYSTPRYRLFRRILFPYSGTEPLTFRQGVRVMLGWILLIPVTVSLLIAPFAALLSYSLVQILWTMLFAFLSGVLIFGGLGLLIIFMGNSAARFHQRRKVSDAHNN